MSQEYTTTMRYHQDIKEVLDCPFSGLSIVRISTSPKSMQLRLHRPKSPDQVTTEKYSECAIIEPAVEKEKTNWPHSPRALPPLSKFCGLAVSPLQQPTVVNEYLCFCKKAFAFPTAHCWSHLYRIDDFNLHMLWIVLTAILKRQLSSDFESFQFTSPSLNETRLIASLSQLAAYESVPNLLWVHLILAMSDGLGIPDDAAALP